GARSARTARTIRLRRLRAGTGRHRSDTRPVARARARHLRARRLGHRVADADPVRARSRRGVDDGAGVALAARMADAAGAERFRGGGVLRLVRPQPVQGRRRHDLGNSFKVGTVIWVVVVIVAVLLLLALLLVAGYNRLVRLRNRTDNAWAQVDVQLRRRYDLIPNL